MAKFDKPDVETGHFMETGPRPDIQKQPDAKNQTPVGSNPLPSSPARAIVPEPPDIPKPDVLKSDTAITDAPRVEASKPELTGASDRTNERIPPMSMPNTDKLRRDVNASAEDVAVLARQAVDAIRKVADALAAETGAKTSEAVAAAKAAGVATVDSLGGMADDAKVATEHGIDVLGQSVARKPITALAIAGGVGLLLGWMSRPGPLH